MNYDHIEYEIFDTNFRQDFYHFGFMGNKIVVKDSLWIKSIGQKMHQKPFGINLKEMMQETWVQALVTHTLFQDHILTVMSVTC